MTPEAFYLKKFIYEQKNLSNSSHHLMHGKHLP